MLVTVAMDAIEEQPTTSSRSTSRRPTLDTCGTSLSVNNSRAGASSLLSKKKSAPRLTLKRPSTAPVSGPTLPVLPVAIIPQTPGTAGPDRNMANPQESTGHFWPHTEESGSKFTPSFSGMISDATSRSPEPLAVESDRIAENKDSYDWNLFVTAYALGQWDSAQIPIPPTLTVTSPPPLSHSETSSPQYDPLSRPSMLRRSMTSAPLTVVSRSMRSISSDSASLLNSTHQGGTLLTGTSSSSSTKDRSLSQRRGNTPRLPPETAFRIHRHSESDSLKRPYFDDAQGASPIPSPGNSATAAATLRWAASGISVRPLAVPSPERELTDPFHDAPAAYSRVEKQKSASSMKQTKSSITPVLWKGLQATTPGESSTSSRSCAVSASGFSDEFSPESGPSWMSLPRPTTAPIRSSRIEEGGDYFNLEHSSGTSLTPHFHADSSAESDADPLLRSELLNRKISEPIPLLTALLPSHSPNETLSQPSKPYAGVKHPPEEDFYYQHQWLSAPNPPDEEARLRALYRFNLLHTAKDPNFDRIVHLAKLVFQTRGVGISLLTSEYQWFKAEAGMSLVTTSRNVAFCAHTILQRSDEPTISLNVTKDWRFSANPLVTGPPGIRFYAGAPLRTADGFNIGCLCLLDDRPRSEFTPRHRHALKEFAAIIVREMELWRDKIQLRVRDRIQVSMECFARETLQNEPDPKSTSPVLSQGSMDHIYNRAVELVKRTLDVEGACVMDVSRSGLHDPSTHSEGSISINVFSAGEKVFTGTHGLTQDEYEAIVDFFSRHRDGYAAESHIPACFRALLSSDLVNVLVVPIFDVDERPFALLSAYNTSGISNNFLDGHELPYLRAMGVIILSAVLKRRMTMADSAKSLFISNISHELRTPLHGILAAAELLADSRLNHHQQAFLQTVQACGASLVETVNHVLDYTKLSGNTRAGGVEHVIPPTRVDVMQLIEEAVEGCWVGFRARAAHQASGTDIGTVYSPPNKVVNHQHVETVVDIALRREGWSLVVEKGGIRRILMNLIGNSLKFTTSGFIKVMLREASPHVSTPEGYTRIEIAVIDTGKGISKSFLEGQLFQPFSQENPLQTGTGLGLAIVKSIVKSRGVRGELDVSSKEGAGTEMRISFDIETTTDPRNAPVEDATTPISHAPRLSVQLIHFNEYHKGKKLLKDTVSEYLTSWWGFRMTDAPYPTADILIVDEDVDILKELQDADDFTRPVIILSSVRGDTTFMASIAAFEKSGGFCRVLFKPGGPSKLRQVLMTCISMVKMLQMPQRNFALPGMNSVASHLEEPTLPEMHTFSQTEGQPFIIRRTSDSTETPLSPRPRMPPRRTTYHKSGVSWQAPTPPTPSSATPAPPEPVAVDQEGLTVSVGTEALLLKSSINSMQTTRSPRILVVEDNDLLRGLLIKWIKAKGYTYREGVDGQQGVEIFSRDGPFDIVLIDLSMPVLDGIGATTQIRSFEASRCRMEGSSGERPTRILALTGMSGLDDKRRAFEAGVDGYLVKPVAFKTLNALFQQLGIT